MPSVPVDMASPSRRGRRDGSSLRGEAPWTSTAPAAVPPELMDLPVGVGIDEARRIGEDAHVWLPRVESAAVRARLRFPARQVSYWIPRPVRKAVPMFRHRWSVPERVLVCIKRKQRRQILFALKPQRFPRLGRGGRSRRNSNSQWSCR